MKREALTIILTSALILTPTYAIAAEPDSTLQSLQQSARRDLEHNILPFWLKYSIDTQNGGFVGRITNNNIPQPDAHKGLVLNTRILWTFSAAHMFDSKPAYVKASRRAYEYFIENFEDLWSQWVSPEIAAKIKG